MALICPKCATENSDSAKFCKGCGQGLLTTSPNTASTIACGKCNTENSLGAKFCKGCGTLMSAPVPTPEVTVAPPPPPRPVAAAPVQVEPIKVKQPPVTEDTKKSSAALLWGGLAVAGLLVAGGVYMFMAKSSPPTPEAAPVAVTPAPVPAPPAIPAAAPEPAPAPAPPKAAPKPIAPKPAPVPVAAQKTAPSTASAAAPTPATPSPAAQPAAPAGPSSPQEACGKRVFLALALCMQEQCRTPQFTNHAQCVQMRQDQKERQERSMSP